MVVANGLLHKDGSMALHPTELFRCVLPPDALATELLGEQLGQNLRPGDVLALVGEVGAGKTTLTRGVARGMKVFLPGAVASPTYLLVVEHPGPIRLLHADAYLPTKLHSFLRDGGMEYLCSEDVIAVVEWADRIAEELPSRTLWLHMTTTTAGGRAVVMSCCEPVAFPWAAGLSAG
ncbi:MAG: tRNA (adenosine(37)-N6)-threonylcarbamoyltransferase complex ATPase subunit type 1 TsaE [Planctomycetes bacterium]|nr:tRNA (adenosine(37)-N6)-threonylcarbamoyltransferase complex ATPase subunit type 1 TsaE [Planctomycetota bacterium]